MKLKITFLICRYFDWLKASTDEIDLVLGIFITKIVPTRDNRALGTRYTPDSLKQMKTGLQNLLSFMLKRSDKLDEMPFFSSLYTTKRNKYDEVPHDKQQGDRKRTLIDPVDQAKRDQFLTQPLEKIACPEDLLLIVGNALLEGDISRGTSVLKQIKRSCVRIEN